MASPYDVPLSAFQTANTGGVAMLQEQGVPSYLATILAILSLYDDSSWNLTDNPYVIALTKIKAVGGDTCQAAKDFAEYFCVQLR